MSYAEVTLPSLRILHHNSSHIRKPTGRQPHGSRTHQRAAHDQQIRMRLRHARADCVHEGQDNQRGDGVGDEGRDDKDQGGEDDEDAVEAHALDFCGDGGGDGVEEARGVDGFAEGEAAGCEDDDGPEEVVEVFFCEDAGAEEEGEWDDGYDAHVAEDVFELVAYAPEDYGDDGDDADEPLHACEFVFHWPYRDDCEAFGGEGDDEEEPDEQD